MLSNFHGRLLVLFCLLLLHSLVFAAIQPALQAYEARLPSIEAQIPELTSSAEQAADNNLAYPNARLNLPQANQGGFSEELIARAGGLAIAFPTETRSPTATERDFVLLTVRSWETQGLKIVKQVQEYKNKGWAVVLFASAAGQPKNLNADFLIDNGAPTGGAEYNRINALVNVTLGWMWCCEYAAAMSRQLKFPAILYSVGMPGAKEYNKPLQVPEGRPTIVRCPRAIPAGDLAKLYFVRVKGMIEDLKSDQIQGQVNQAADVIAKQFLSGGRVGVTGTGHLILDEIMQDTQVPWVAFNSAGNPDEMMKKKMQPGELLMWIGYTGTKTAYRDYGKAIIDAGLQAITSYNPEPGWLDNLPPTLAHIDQRWRLPDAEVAIPVFPYKMAPVSGIIAGLTFRMLDDEVVKRLVLK